MAQAQRDVREHALPTNPIVSRSNRRWIGVFALAFGILWASQRLQYTRSFAGQGSEEKEGHVVPAQQIFVKPVPAVATSAAVVPVSAPPACTVSAPTSSSTAPTVIPAVVPSASPVVVKRDVSVRLLSTDGRPFTWLPLEDMWHWRPWGTTVVGADPVKKSADLVCDDHYTATDHSFGSCRFAAADVRNMSRVYVKLNHWDQFTTLVPSDNRYYSTSHAGSDFAYDQPKMSFLASRAEYRAAFAINMYRGQRQDKLFAIPIGIARYNAPGHREPNMYLLQRTGFNMATKLCWAPIMVAELLSAGSAPLHVLHMNFNTGTNPGVRVPTKDFFTGKPWVLNDVDAGDDVGRRISPVKSEQDILQTLQILWEKHGDITGRQWFREQCGPNPHLPVGMDPEHLGEVPLPGYPSFLRQMSNMPFILCPEGNGVSSHRTWEGLYAGTIPVVRELDNSLDDLYRGLPVMLVKDWDEVTPESLLCFAVELLTKSLGRLMESPADVGLNLTYFESELSILFGDSPIVRTCAAAIYQYAQRHSNTHVGYISYDSLAYEWWHQYQQRLAEGQRAQSRWAHAR